MFATALRSWEEIPITELAAALSSVDRTSLSDDETVAVLRARQRLANHLAAERAADMVEVSHRHDGGTPVDQANAYGEFAPLEVGSALTLTRRKAEADVALAFDVTERLPAVWASMHAGHLDWAKAKVIADGVSHLDLLPARRVVDQVLDDAPRLTTGQLAARLRKLCLQVDPHDAKRRYERSIADRRVETWPHNDGTGDLWGRNLPPDRLNAAIANIDRLARQLADDRTLDQKRADVLLDLLCGGATGQATAPQVQVVVDLETLIGLRDRAADIPGWGPVLADVARKALTEDKTGRLKVNVVDGDDAVDVTVRRPTAAQRRAVRRRHPTCVFPGCRLPAHKTDLDHTRRHVDGGPTHTSNLAPLCRFHHRAKDEGGWSYRIDPDGTIHWTSPLGITYIVKRRGP
ncbi:MAG: DUF222 domain-containing protein [Acidimicrobiia bacterium]